MQAFLPLSLPFRRHHLKITQFGNHAKKNKSKRKPPSNLVTDYTALFSDIGLCIFFVSTDVTGFSRFREETRRRTLLQSPFPSHSDSVSVFSAEIDAHY